MLCSFALFVSSFGFIGPEKPRCGSGQLRYLFILTGCSDIVAILTDGKFQTVPNGTAETFNNYLLNIVKKLAKASRVVPIDCTVCKSTFSLQPVTSAFIQRN